MEKLTSDEIANALNRRYQDSETGSEFPVVLDEVVKSSGYNDAAEIIQVKKEVLLIWKDIRVRRAS